MWNNDIVDCNTAFGMKWTYPRLETMGDFAKQDESLQAPDEIVPGLRPRPGRSIRSRIFWRALLNVVLLAGAGLI